MGTPSVPTYIKVNRKVQEEPQAEVTANIPTCRDTKTNAVLSLQIPKYMEVRIVTQNLLLDLCKNVVSTMCLETVLHLRVSVHDGKNYYI